MGSGIFGRSNRGQTATFFACSAAERHGQKEWSPKNGVNHADGGEHADPFESLTLQPTEKLIEVDVVARRHCRTHSGRNDTVDAYEKERSVFIRFKINSSVFKWNIMIIFFLGGGLNADLCLDAKP